MSYLGLLAAPSNSYFGGIKSLNDITLEEEEK